MLLLFIYLYRNLGKEEGIDANQLGKLFKQTEGKMIPFDRIQAALEVVKPAKKGELSKEEFIKVKQSKRYFCFIIIRSLLS